LANSMLQTDILHDTSSILEKPWLAKQIAGRAEAPGSLEERMELFALLASLPLKKQTVSIARCSGRDELVQALVSREEYGVLMAFLQSDFAHWLPDSGDFSDLFWLLKTLLAAKESTMGKKARVVFQTQSGLQVRESVAMLEALMEETIEAAAAAWIRCLNGPGGDHRVWELPKVLLDGAMAEAVFSQLANDPRPLALILEDKRPELAQTGLEPENLEEKLQKGYKAAEYCCEVVKNGMLRLKLR